jgi:hypothetical protein
MARRGREAGGAGEAGAVGDGGGTEGGARGQAGARCAVGTCGALFQNLLNFEFDSRLGISSTLRVS